MKFSRQTVLDIQGPGAVVMAERYRLEEVDIDPAGQTIWVGEPERVAALVRAYRAGAKFPPLVVSERLPVSKHGLDDGNHRWAALVECGVTVYPAFVPEWD